MPPGAAALAAPLERGQLMRDLTGNVAWITGASSGIGESAALKLAEAGAIVVLSGRRRELLDGVAKQVQAAGGTATVEALDVADKQAVLDVVGRIKARHGRIDIGVFSAGVNVTDETGRTSPRTIGTR